MNRQELKKNIKEAINTTLVIENRKSIDLCVDKIIKILYDEKIFSLTVENLIKMQNRNGR